MKVEKKDIKELGFTEQLLYGNDIKDNRIKELEEENKKLKKENGVMKIQVIEAREDRDRLMEENRKLKEEIEKRNKIVKYYRNEKKNLREKVKELKKDYISTREEWLNTD